MSDEITAMKYPNLSELTDLDLVRLLAEYVNVSHAIVEADKDFIYTIQLELKSRSKTKRLSL